MKIKLKADLEMYLVDRGPDEPLSSIMVPAGTEVEHHSSLLTDRRTRCYRVTLIKDGRKYFRGREVVARWEDGIAEGVWYDCRLTWPDKLGLDRKLVGIRLFAKLQGGCVKVVSHDSSEDGHYWSIALDEAHRIVRPYRDPKGSPVVADQAAADRLLKFYAG